MNASGERRLEDADVITPRAPSPGLHPLVGAWLTRARDADRTLRVAAATPALFRPEYVATVTADRAEAMRWARFWAGPAGALR